MEYYKKNGIIEETEMFHRGVRDNNTINIFKCLSTEALVVDKIIETLYFDKTLNYWNAYSINDARQITLDDDTRRYKMVSNLKQNSLLDVGCGNGGFINMLDKDSIEIYGTELNKFMIDLLTKEGFLIFDNIKKIEKKYFDCITIFHVLEHAYDSIELLKQIKSKMHKKSVLIIEVPHANDILIKHYKNNNFKKFTFWSQHLILHTKKSLEKLLMISGFSKINIKYEQRYNIFNHIFWLTDGKPGGHKSTILHDNELIKAYNSFVCRNELSDTLIAYCYI